MFKKYGRCTTLASSREESFGHDPIVWVRSRPGLSPEIAVKLLRAILDAAGYPSSATQSPPRRLMSGGGSGIDVLVAFPAQANEEFLPDARWKEVLNTIIQLQAKYGLGILVLGPGGPTIRLRHE